MSTTQAAHETERDGPAPESAFSDELQRASEVTERRPTSEDIAREAYLIYLANGSQDGHDLEHWLEAERRLDASEKSGMPQQARAGVQHGNGDSRHKSARPSTDRRRTPRQSVPTYLPV